MRTQRCIVALTALGLLLFGWLAAAPAGAAQPASQCFAETGKCIQGRFLDNWQSHGGLALNGYPLSDERQELLEDGHTYTVQYFERVRMELHPENQPPYDVLLGQFGRRVLRDRFTTDIGVYRQTIAPAAPLAGQIYFSKTGHNLGGRFLDYWQANGDLMQFGYPLTEVFSETLDNGQTYQVQYFERARMELHPENQPPYDVLLGQFGRAILTQADMLTGDFNFIYVTSEDVRGRLGRPIAPQAQISGATQLFERGQMFWRGDKHLIIVLAGDPQTGQLIIDARQVAPYFADTWQEGQDPGGGPAPPPGLYYPQRGFGKVWRDNDYVRSALGYARAAAESGYTMTLQDFERGVMLTSQTSEGQFIYVVNFIYPCNSCTPQGAYERFTPRSQ
ncbi:MAG: hypothetical protein ACTHMR_07595 [Thermomicrobiales bacterium]